ncbi:hypothetical protein [Nostoc sp.]|uniref:hypothetical protein n=1 Tax=Nostoc sp. TaxID=1180 RepID=UPI002FF31334
MDVNIPHWLILIIIGPPKRCRRQQAMLSLPLPQTPRSQNLDSFSTNLLLLAFIQYLVVTTENSGILYQILIP